MEAVWIARSRGSSLRRGQETVRLLAASQGRTGSCLGSCRAETRDRSDRSSALAPHEDQSRRAAFESPALEVAEGVGDGKAGRSEHHRELLGTRSANALHLA